MAEVEGLTHDVLGQPDCLNEKGVVDRRSIDDRPLRVEYFLPEHGISLDSVLDPMADWGRKRLHVDG